MFTLNNSRSRSRGWDEFPFRLHRLYFLSPPHPSPDLEQHPTLLNVGDRVLATVRTNAVTTTDEHRRGVYNTTMSFYRSFVLHTKHFPTIKLHTETKMLCSWYFYRCLL